MGGLFFLLALGTGLATGWGLPIIAIAIVIVAAPFILLAMTRESGEQGADDDPAVEGPGEKRTDHWYG